MTETQKENVDLKKDGETELPNTPTPKPDAPRKDGGSPNDGDKPPPKNSPLEDYFKDKARFIVPFTDSPTIPAQVLSEDPDFKGKPKKTVEPTTPTKATMVPDPKDDELSPSQKAAELLGLDKVAETVKAAGEAAIEGVANAAATAIETVKDLLAEKDGNTDGDKDGSTDNEKRGVGPYETQVSAAQSDFDPIAGLALGVEAAKKAVEPNLKNTPTPNVKDAHAIDVLDTVEESAEEDELDEIEKRYGAEQAELQDGEKKDGVRED
ncbi:hypothetical protein K402DRAFT_465909 [Aulographum hederae CBS 113979]|uniref:Uncharacterized protein n=1 Tax=Aulographum hederae CBS 113979 TaxID=1176131 RepID=A0A6G1GRH9_9PEZI|nr:hypothetical protein K402DRAFT_465909 [Aulographum hederae CBS 113979]